MTFYVKSTVVIFRTNRCHPEQCHPELACLALTQVEAGRRVISGSASISGSQFVKCIDADPDIKSGQHDNYIEVLNIN